MTIYGRSEELVSRCIECDLAEPESLASLGGSAPGLVDGILSEPRGMPQSIPYSRITSTMIHFNGHSWQTPRHKASMMLLTLIMTLRMVTSMKRNFSRESSPLYILFWLLHFKQKRGENWSKNLKEMPGPSSCNYIITIQNQMLHNMTSIALTTDITSLTLNDSWKGTVRQLLSHFKEKLRLLDSLIPVSDQLPETTRITFLQRAVQQNHDLRQIHVMDSVWRFKTDSTDALTFDTYYNLLWDAAHQYDLHQVKKGPQRKAFFSQQEEISDDDEYANAEEQFSTDPEPEEHSPYSVY